MRRRVGCGQTGASDWGRGRKASPLFSCSLLDAIELSLQVLTEALANLVCLWRVLTICALQVSLPGSEGLSEKVVALGGVVCVWQFLAEGVYPRLPVHQILIQPVKALGFSLPRFPTLFKPVEGLSQPAYSLLGEEEGDSDQTSDEKQQSVHKRADHSKWGVLTSTVIIAPLARLIV